MLLATWERLLNRGIADSTAARTCAEGLEGESLAVEVAGLGIAVTVRVRRGEVLLGVRGDEPVSAEISASPFDLLRLATAGGFSHVRGTQAEISGDLNVAEQFAELLKLARPDLEEELSGWIGDIAAHEIGDFSRALARWGAAAGTSVTASTAEYLQEESRVMPGRYEVGAFYRDVERLSDDVDGAAERLDRLARRLVRSTSRRKRSDQLGPPSVDAP